MKVVFQYSDILPVKTYGGIERILFWHMCELVKQGIQVVLIGHPDSDVEKFGIQLIKLAFEDYAQWENHIPADADIVHLSYNYQLKGKTPLIITVHGNGKIGEIFPKNSVFVSKKHAEIHGSKTYVHNAIDFKEYPFIESKKSWNNFLFLAKASWRVKNLKQTVSACRENNKHLQVIGGRWFGLSRYIHNHGIIGGEQKMSIMRNCDALIFPVRWHEPFGIAVIEAMSQGLPVIGSIYGSLPELITPEVGFIVKDYAELKSILKNPLREFSASKIRTYAEENFSLPKHAISYIDLYKKVIGGEELNAKNPSYIYQVRPEELLPF